MKNTKLFQKVYGALIGSAIGDAMGGPVEGFTYQKIEQDYGLVNTLLPYTEIPIAVHGPFDLKAGCYTDDSRMSKIFAQAMIRKGGVANSRDIAKAYIEYYFGAKRQIEKDFIEEYYNKAIYLDRKEIFGGQPTNGAIMGIAPYGVITPCNPSKAHDDAFEAAFMTVGYARYAASMAAAAISAAMKEGADDRSIIQDMMQAVSHHKKQVEDKGWADCHMYPYVGRKSEKLVEDAVKVAQKYDDVYAVREELYQTVVQEFFADGAESLAIAMAFVTLSKGDFVKSVIGCVNFGRDNDSSASIAGAVTGALNGADAIPQEWIDLVESVNEGPTFYELAEQICNIIQGNYQIEKNAINLLGQLME
jgi:ADP-ribosylglycohydrolase